MSIATLALLLVVLVDLMGQGVIFPIIDDLMMATGKPFLPSATPETTRQFNYGLVIGVFYFSWFRGAAYISRLSDMIGRKAGIVICLVGNLVGYAFTILAIDMGSLWLLILGRAVTGLTAANQPIAQAAMADLGGSEAERTRNLGYVVSAFSLGIVVGPILGGVLSDPSILGNAASLALPFYVCGAVVAIVLLFVLAVFDDSRQERLPLRIQPFEIFTVLYRIAERPVILRISVAYFCFMFVSITFTVFLDDYLTNRFGADTLAVSLANVVFGITLAVSSAFLVTPFCRRFTKRAIVLAASVVTGLAGLLLAASPALVPAFAPIVIFGVAYALGFPTMLSIYSESVDETEKGWVMGVATALFTLAAALTSFAGGEIMGIAIRLPFYYAAVAAALTVVLIVALWRYPPLRAIVSTTSGKAPQSAGPPD